MQESSLASIGGGNNFLSSILIEYLSFTWKGMEVCCLIVFNERTVCCFLEIDAGRTRFVFSTIDDEGNDEGSDDESDVISLFGEFDGSGDIGCKAQVSSLGDDSNVVDVLFTAIQLSLLVAMLATVFFFNLDSA